MPAAPPGISLRPLVGRPRRRGGRLTRTAGIATLGCAVLLAFSLYSILAGLGVSTVFDGGAEAKGWAYLGLVAIAGLLLSFLTSLAAVVWARPRIPALLILLAHPGAVLVAVVLGVVLGARAATVHARVAASHLLGLLPH